MVEQVGRRSAARSGGRLVVLTVAALLVAAAASVWGSGRPADVVAAPPIEPVTDDSGVISISVPPEWAERSTDLSTLDNTPSIVAAGDLSVFLPDGAAAGVSVHATAPLDHPFDANNAFIFINPGCTPADPATVPFAHPAFSSAAVAHNTCPGGLQSTFYGATTDGAYWVTIDVVTQPADQALAEAIATSFVYAGTGGAPATTLPADPPGLSVTNAGDPAAPVVLRQERTVGAVSTLTIQETYEGADSFALNNSSGGSVGEATTEARTFSSTGTAEILNEDPEGTVIYQYTPAEITGSLTTDDPDLTSYTEGFAPLVGVPLAMGQGPDGEPVGVAAPEGTELTPEQQPWASGVPTLGYVLPATPVGVGAEWTVPTWAIAAEWAVLQEVPITYGLDSVEGDVFTVTGTIQADIAGMVDSAVIVDAAGTFTRTVTITGSLSTPGQVEVRVTEVSDVSGNAFDESAPTTHTHTSELVYTETPA